MTSAPCLRRTRTGRWAEEHRWAPGPGVPSCLRCGRSAPWRIAAERTGALSGGEAAVPAEYALLGLRPGCGGDEARRAYRAAAKTAHPDAGGTNERMAAVNAARDAVLRREAAGGP